MRINFQNLGLCHLLTHDSDDSRNRKRSPRVRIAPYAAGMLLSKDLKGLAAFWTKAKYGKMSIEGRNAVNTETPHYSKAGAVDDGKILIAPRNANIPRNL